MQPSPCNIWIKALEGAEEKPRCRLCPSLVPQHIVLTGMCFTSCSVHSGQARGSHSHIRAQDQWSHSQGAVPGCIPEC